MQKDMRMGLSSSFFAGRQIKPIFHGLQQLRISFHSQSLLEAPNALVKMVISLSNLQRECYQFKHNNFITLSSMRRNYRMGPATPKQFIHTFHINEVPLPFYNPLEDPHLRSFFSNRKVSRHIQQMGFLYEPRREYPYTNRRAKNAYKFHKDNSSEIPLTHQVKNSEASKSFMLNSQAFTEDDNLFLSPPLKRRAESDFVGRVNSKIPSLSEIMSKRPSTQTQKYRMIVSSEGKGSSRIFKRQSFSSNKISNRKNPEND